MPCIVLTNIVSKYRYIDRIDVACPVASVMDLKVDFCNVDLQRMKCVTDLLRLDFMQTS